MTGAATSCPYGCSYSHVLGCPGPRTGSANVAHLRTIWRELATQAAIDGDWTAADNAANAYDTARTLHESESETP
jgi:hypothetical protein